MKQTIEEAEKEYCDKNYPYSDLNIKLLVENAFEAGAEWQSKQSPWISVKERLPKYNIEVIIYHKCSFYIGTMYYSMLSNWWRISENEADDKVVDVDDLWLPIASLDKNP